MTTEDQQQPTDPEAPKPRVPPHSAETETAVLSAWSLHDRFGTAWKPDPDLFYVKHHRVIASAMSRLDPKVRDEASLLAQLDADGVLAAVGGSTAVFKVIKAAPAYGDPWPHLARLREYKALRDVLGLIDVASAEAYEHKNLGATVAKLQDAIRVGIADTGTKVLSVADMVRAVALSMESQRTDERCSTGLPSLDRDSGGFRKENVTIFGGATSYGKSSYAVFVADVALKAGKRPLIVSFEDSEELYGRRLVARRAEVNPSVLREGRYRPSDDEWGRVLGVAETAETFPFFINAIGKSVESVATDILAMCASEGIDLVLADYVQAAKCARRMQDRRNEVTYAARTLIDAIKQGKAGGLLFSQFKRTLENGDVPTKHDLKESGDLENMAENVFLGYLDENGRRIIKADKCKDGIAGRDYPVGWSDIWSGFTGELAEDGYAYSADGQRYV